MVEGIHVRVLQRKCTFRSMYAFRRHVHGHGAIQLHLEDSAAGKALATHQELELTVVSIHDAHEILHRLQQGHRLESIVPVQGISSK